MSAKQSFVINFTGFSHRSIEWQQWMIQFANNFPESTLVLFEEDRASLANAIQQRSLSFSNNQDLLNWLAEHAECIVNLTPDFEPLVSPIPSLLILPVFRPSPFWSAYVPNQLGLHGDRLVELAMRTNAAVSNSPELLDLFRRWSTPEEKQYITHTLTHVSMECLEKWIEYAIKHFNRSLPSKPSNPLVSVITPSYNQGKYLGKTLNSVFSQDYSSIEYFVVDGGSTDHSIEVLNQYQGKIRWVSEKDSGYPEAVNKGFQRCNGKYFMWLPSDDLLFSKHSISQLVETAEKTGADVVYGDAFYINQEDRILEPYRTANYSPEKLRDWALICQPSALFKADIFRRVGGLNQSFKCISDYALWLKMSENGARFVRIGAPISCYRIHGESLTAKQKNISYREIFDFQLSSYSTVNRSWVMGAFKEIVLQQNLGIRLGSSRNSKTSNPFLNSAMARRFVNSAMESFLAENPYFQRFIRRRIEPREPIWNRGK